MCTIDKMLIKGIRSFSPENSGVIAFFKPLTLIVGPNGAGKTTIIECLKHACTGELPPNARSGQTFIHDPKVAGEVETKGQIKLRFKTAAGKDVVCIRSFQLTQKASKLEYKAIESVLQTINSLTGEKVCLSYRCADMDREVPMLMGVSKAILENVIFVHQDEANWPLADPATLKKKFDDIFSATRYTKALEVIKKLIKDQSQLIKQYKLKLDHLQDLRTAANRLLESIRADTEKAEHLKQQAASLETRIAASQERIRTAENAIARLRSLQQGMKVLETRRGEKAKEKARMLANLGDDVTDDTDEDLHRWANEFNEKIADFERDVARLKREMMSARARSEQERQANTRDCQEQGKLQGEAEAHVADKGKRDRLIQVVCSKHGLGEPGKLPLSEDKARSIMAAMRQRLQDMQNSLNQLKALNTADIDKLTKSIESTQKNYFHASSQIRAKQSEKEKHTTRISQLEDEISNSMVSELDLRRIDEAERITKEHVDRLSTRVKEQSYDKALGDLSAQLGVLEQRLKALAREKDGLASESAERVQLRLEKEELESKTAAMKRVEGEIKDKVKKLNRGTMPLPGELKDVFLSIVRAMKSQREEMSEKAVTAGKKLAGAEERLKGERNRLNRHKREKEQKVSVLQTSLVEGLLEPGGFEKQLDQVMKEKQEYAASLQSSKSLGEFWMHFAKIGRESHMCPCCDRPFNGKEKDDFQVTIRTKQSGFSSNEREYAEKLQVAENRWSALSRLQPVYLEYRQLNETLIPKAEATVAQLQTEVDATRDTHDDCLGLLAQASADLDDVERLRASVETVDRLVRETAVARLKVEETEYRLDAVSQALRSMGDVQAEMAAADEQREVVQRKIKRLRDEQDASRDELAKAEAKWRNARDEKIMQLHKVQLLNMTKEEKRKLEGEMARASMEIQTLEQQLEPLDRDLRSLRQELENKRERAEGEEAERLTQLQALQLDLDKLKSKQADIDAYSVSGKVEQLRAVEERIAGFQERQRGLDERAKVLESEVAVEEKKIRDQGDFKRVIDDNIAYRQVATEEKQLEDEEAALAARVQEVGDVAALQEEIRRATAEVQGWLAEKNRGQGMAAAYESSIAKNRSELQVPEYRNIEKRCQEQLVQLKTTEMANTDLDAYYNALDNALMKFHSMKMEEINKIVKELWQQTYRGQDIDYIEIRSDAEGGGTRSYSYRVCMRSSDAELDMRGRCSAGQKVLASLVIRLALAETFCLNCGILALDEPTTNLDAPNAESLAGALLRIMEDRRGQENFQLIVITHDERFAQLIGQRQHAERYYRISKNERQHSTIELQDIFE